MSSAQVRSVLPGRGVRVQVCSSKCFGGVCVYLLRKCWVSAQVHCPYCWSGRSQQTLWILPGCFAQFYETSTVYVLVIHVSSARFSSFVFARLPGAPTASLARRSIEPDKLAAYAGTKEDDTMSSTTPKLCVLGRILIA